MSIARLVPVRPAASRSLSTVWSAAIATALLLLLGAGLLPAGAQGSRPCALTEIGESDLREATTSLGLSGALELPANLGSAVPAACDPGKTTYLVYLSGDEDARTELAGAFADVDEDILVLVDALADRQADPTATQVREWYWRTTAARGQSTGAFSPIFIDPERRFLLVQPRR